MPTVRYQFVATGHDQVTTAFKGITASARTAAQTEVASARASRAAAETKRRGLTETQRLALRVAADQERAAKRTEAAAIRSAAAQERASKKAADAAIRDANRVASAKEKAADRAYQRIVRDLEREQKAESRAAATRSRAAQRAAQRASQVRERQYFSIAKDAALGIGSAVLSTGSALVTGAARDSLRLNEASRRVSIAGRQAGQGFVDPNVLSREFSGTAISTPGIKSADVAEAMAMFVGKTGRLDIARQSQGTFATVASASGASIQDVSRAAADLFEKFDIKSVEEMQDALAALTEQGKQGSFELKDAARQFSKLSAAASRFGLDKGASGVATLGGLTQIARSATGSPEQAASALEATMRQLVSKSGDIKTKFKVDVFKDKGKTQARNIEDVLIETIAGSGGSLPALQKIFGEEGIRAISPMISTFNQAEAEKTGSGVAALRAQLEKAINTTEGWSGVMKDAEQAQSGATSKMTAAWEMLVARIGEEVTPRLESFAGKLVDLEGPIDALAGTAGVLAEGFSALFDVLASIPGMEKIFGQSDERKQNKARKELEKLDAKRQIGPLTAAETAKREQLERDAGLEMKSASEVFRVKSDEELKRDIDAAATPPSATTGAVVGALGAFNPVAGFAALGATNGSNAQQQALLDQQSIAKGGTGAESSSGIAALLLKMAGPLAEVATAGSGAAAALKLIEAQSRPSIASG